MPVNKNYVTGAVHKVENILMGILEGQKEIPQGQEKVDGRRFASEWALASPEERMKMIDSQGGTDALLDRYGGDNGG